MGKTFFPPDPFILQPTWINFFENTTLIQFNHRILATITGLMIFYTCITNYKQFKNTLVGNLLKCLILLIILQYTLGIIALKLAVPILVGSMHQMGSILVLSIIILILSEIFLKKKGAIK